jgi:hypothetical protein
MSGNVLLTDNEEIYRKLIEKTEMLNKVKKENEEIKD